MDEEQAKSWVKDKANQQRVIDSILKTTPAKKTKLAIFMAGIPGAGKTEFVQNSRSEVLKSMVVIEHDQLVVYIEGYSPENYYVFRKAGSVLVTRLFNECLKLGLSFIFYGTLSHDRGKRNIQKCINKGFAVLVIYIYQDAHSAWQLTKDRELVKKRSIEKDGFIKTCQSINKNLHDIFQTFHKSDEFTFWIIKKNGAPGMESSELVIYDHQENVGNVKEIESVLDGEYNLEEID